MTADEARDLIRSVLREELRQSANVEHDFMTIEQVADMLDVHPRTVAKLVRRDELPARRLGKSYRFHRAEVLEWLEQRAVRPGGHLHKHAATLRQALNG